jgi:hypothetical protein
MDLNIDEQIPNGTIGYFSTGAYTGSMFAGLVLQFLMLPIE